jgi:tripartite-type tricarboxylate transporter receptor subunit TctC
VQVYFATTAILIEHVRTGKLRALAVTTAKRSEVLPDIPTVSEFLPGFEASVWFGIGAPNNTPVDIVNKLNREINAASRISRSRRGLRTWAPSHFRARPPTLAITFRQRPRSGRT